MAMAAVLPPVHCSKRDIELTCELFLGPVVVATDLTNQNTEGCCVARTTGHIYLGLHSMSYAILYTR